MELKIEDLKAGDKLECIDRAGFDKCHALNKEINCFIVSRLRRDGVVVSGDYIIYRSEIKYFKKKEESSFNNFIDVAVQAYKDNLIGNLFISDNHIEFDRGIESFDYGTTCIENGINFIKSLYQETFTIETEEDMKKCKKEAVVKFMNGNTGIVECECDKDSEFMVLDVRCCITNLKFFTTIMALKGATVTQSK